MIDYEESLEDYKAIQVFESIGNKIIPRPVNNKLHKVFLFYACLYKENLIWFGDQVNTVHTITGINSLTGQLEHIRLKRSRNSRK
tara:strand:+ start:464 stop:718 length:255 start_codon:yes stop_codon:yes gene_type:complete